MRRWVTDQFGPPDRRPLVLIDPDAIVDIDELARASEADIVVLTHDWFELRRAWERHVRHPHGDSRPGLVVRDPTVSTDVDLPYDIATGSTVRRIRLPVPRDLRLALLALDDTAADAAVVAITARRVPPTDALLTVAAGITPSPIASRPAEFALALRLASTPQPSPIELVARERLTDPLAAAIVAEEPQVFVVAEAWARWLRDGDRSPWNAHIETARSELTDIFLAGRLQPAEVTTEGVPAWALVRSSPCSRPG